jgi:hypothetical protein
MAEDRIKVRIRIPELDKTVEVDVPGNEYGRKILNDTYDRFKQDFNNKGVDDIRKMVLYEHTGRTPLNRANEVKTYTKPHENAVEVVVGTLEAYKKRFFGKVKEEVTASKTAQASPA